MEIVIENPTSDLLSTSAVATTTTSVSPTSATTPMTPSPVNPMFATLPSTHNRLYRAAYVTNDGLISQNVDYYRTLPPQSSRSRHTSPLEPMYDTSAAIPTSVRRVDRSGLLEIVDPEPQRSSTRNRHFTGVESSGHSIGTLPRRIDRSGLLEAVPELPDNCQSNWRSEIFTKNPALLAKNREETPAERKLMGAETAKIDDVQRENVVRRVQTSPRAKSNDAMSQTRRSSAELSGSRDEMESSVSHCLEKCPSPSTTSLNHVPTASAGSASSTSSPYLRRYPSDGPSLASLERPTPVVVADETARSGRNRNSFTCVSPNATKFLPIDALPTRSRQSYVDLTGATYARTSLTPSATSPISSARTETALTSLVADIDITKTRQHPDCLGRLSPRSRNERQSPPTMSSSIPDVIGAATHGSRTRTGDDDGNRPEGERLEAEGCEHKPTDGTEETRLSFKGNKKIIHNDSMQTLRVIILSEQL